MKLPAVLTTMSPPMGVLPEGENDTGMQKLYAYTEQAGMVLFEPLHPAIPEANYYF